MALIAFINHMGVSQLNPPMFGKLEIYLQTNYQDSSSKKDFIVTVDGNHWDDNYSLSSSYSNASIMNVPKLLVDQNTIGWNFDKSSDPLDPPAENVIWETYGYGKYKFYESKHPNEHFYIDFTDCTYANLSPTDIILKYVEQTDGSGEWYYAKYDQPTPYPWVPVNPRENSIKIHEILTHFPAGSPDTDCFESGSLPDTTPPQKPTNFIIANRYQIGEFVNLTWDANPESDVNHYNVWRKCVYWVYPGGCDLSVIGTTSTNSFTDYEVQISINDGTTDNFIYYVSAVDDSSNESNRSDYQPTWGESLNKMGDEITDIINPIPKAFALEPNHPNPFNPSTMIKYSLPEASSVSLVIYDLLGSEIFSWINNREEPGYKQVTWNGKDQKGNAMPARIYIYKLTAVSTESGEVFTQNRKMILMK